MKHAQIYITGLFVFTFIQLGFLVKGQEISGYDGLVKIHSLQLTETPPFLELTFDVEVQKEAINNRQSWTIHPQLIASDGSHNQFFPTILINGRQKERHFRRAEKFGNEWLMANYPAHRMWISNHTDTILTYKAMVKYADWADDAVLVLHQILESPRKKKQLFSSAHLIKPSTLPREVTPTPETVMPPIEKEPEIRQLHASTYLDFPTGTSTILPDYKNNRHQLDKLVSDLSSVLSDPEKEVLTIQIKGCASPEGSYALNEKLSRERTESLAIYLANRLNLPRSILRASSVAEDWDGLRQLIENSSLADKTNILQIISNDATPDRKEAQLRALGTVWRTLLNEYFPRLRRVEYLMEYTERIYQ